MDKHRRSFLVFSLFAAAFLCEHGSGLALDVLVRARPEAYAAIQHLAGLTERPAELSEIQWKQFVGRLGHAAGFGDRQKDMEVPQLDASSDAIHPLHRVP